MLHAEACMGTKTAAPPWGRRMYSSSLVALLCRVLLLCLPPVVRAERFPMLGTGRCMYKGVPLQGISGMLTGGQEHQQCRNMCAFLGEGCIAFTWNHCNKECIIHGTPEDLVRANNTGLYSWGSADACAIQPMRPFRFMTGIGGSYPSGVPHPFLYVEAEGGKCSSYACFVHEKPCLVDLYVHSNGANVHVKGLFAPNELITLHCPQSPKRYGGVLILQCAGVGQILRKGGRCGLDCDAQDLSVPGYIPVKVPPHAHGEIFDPGCDVVKPGTHGNLVFACDDNRYIAKGTCGQNCAPSYTEIGNFPVSGSLHGVIEDHPCPPEYSGTITLECNHGKQKSRVGCHLNCPSSLHPIQTLGSDPIELVVLDRQHDEKSFERCPAGYSGDLEIHCFDGQLISRGACGLDCALPGTKKFGPVEASWTDHLRHGEIVELECREGGIVEVQCHGGDVVPLNGQECYSACPAGTYVSNGKRTDVIPHMLHGQNITVICPTGSSGTLHIECYKGYFRHTDGYCGLDCDPGNLQLPSGVFVHYGIIPHGEQRSAECDYYYDGNVEVYCDDKLTEAVSGNCQIATADCETSIAMVYNRDKMAEAYLTSEKFDIIENVEMTVGETKTFPCKTGWGAGVVARCVAEDKSAKLEVEGSCGTPCGLDHANGAVLPNTNPPRMHGEELRSACPGFDELEAYSRCVNGEVEVVQVCGAPCLSDTLDGLFDGMLNPLSNGTMVTHSFNVTTLCDTKAGYSGSAAMYCNDGTFEDMLEGECGLRCVNETLGIDLDHLEIETFGCAPGYTGKTFHRCNNSLIVELEPECFRDCTEYGYLSEIVKPPGERYWERPMHHGKETRNCSSFYPDQPDIGGQVTRSCDNGYGVIESLDCHRNCLDAVLDSEDYEFPIVVSSLQHNAVQEFPCGYPYFTGLYAGNFSLTCIHGKLSVVQFECAAHCEAGALMNNGVEISHDLIHLNTIVQLPCDRYSDTTLSVTCRSQVVLVVEGLCHELCPPGVVKNFAHSKLTHLQEEQVDCGDDYTGTVTIQCFDGVAKIVSHQCFEHCAQSTVYPGGPPVHVLAFKHASINTVPCEGSFIDVKCDDGSLFIQDAYTEVCGYKMSLCTCCAIGGDEHYGSHRASFSANQHPVSWMSILLPLLNTLFG
eukprot:GEMP01003509.1.p1 GENE.GEMP01003509.1~~GEMP01003509.1.p1  ORF type:complete len:1144 (+),score=160.65 GEMP01003509.1:294-3725(+)